MALPEEETGMTTSVDTIELALTLMRELALAMLRRAEAERRACLEAKARLN